MHILIELGEVIKDSVIAIHCDVIDINDNIQSADYSHSNKTETEDESTLISEDLLQNITDEATDVFPPHQDSLDNLIRKAIIREPQLWKDSNPASTASMLILLLDKLSDKFDC